MIQKADENKIRTRQQNNNGIIFNERQFFKYIQLYKIYFCILLSFL